MGSDLCTVSGYSAHSGWRMAMCTPPTGFTRCSALVSEHAYAHNMIPLWVRVTAGLVDRVVAQAGRCAVFTIAIAHRKSCGNAHARAAHADAMAVGPHGAVCKCHCVPPQAHWAWLATWMPTPLPPPCANCCPRMSLRLSSAMASTCGTICRG